jgi:hypothetical protein
MRCTLPDVAFAGSRVNAFPNTCTHGKLLLKFLVCLALVTCHFVKHQQFNIQLFRRRAQKHLTRGLVSAVFGRSTTISKLFVYSPLVDIALLPALEVNPYIPTYTYALIAQTEDDVISPVHSLNHSEQQTQQDVREDNDENEHEKRL